MINTKYNKGSFTIHKIHEMHKEECPESMISEKSIRRAVKSGDLPALKVGNRALISWEIFEAWRRGGLKND